MEAEQNKKKGWKVKAWEEVVEGTVSELGRDCVQMIIEGILFTYQRNNFDEK